MIRVISELSGLRKRTLEGETGNPLTGLDFGVPISGLLRISEKNAPHTWLFVRAWGAVLLPTAEQDVEEEKEGQFHRQNDPVLAHHGENSFHVLVSKFCSVLNQ